MSSSATRKVAVAAFAEIEFEVDTRTRIVNAQAFRMNGRHFVRLYGGLALHPLACEDALVFTLLHETGHHCERGRRFEGVKIKNRALGEYRNSCFLPGYIDDKEFEIEREPIDVPCDKVAAIERYKAGNQFSSNWIAN